MSLIASERIEVGQSSIHTDSLEQEIANLAKEWATLFASRFTKDTCQRGLRDNKS